MPPGKGKLMSFTSTSNLILDVHRLNLNFKLEYFKHDGLRDKFIKLITAPARTLLRKRDQFKVLDDVSFKISRGDRVGIIGVNGAGKTTLCRCIGKMIIPDSGTIQINGTCRAIFNASIAVLPELTGRENAMLLASILYPELTDRDLFEIVEESIVFSELGHFIDTPFKNFSKGMQARLCLSLVSSRGCDLLVLDEVYDGADEFFRRKISDRISKLIHNSGAVIIVSHSPDQILSSCNRLILLNNSRIEFDGKVEEGLATYRRLVGKVRGGAYGIE
jgi:ABC-2 type transport system ATP-binding protein